MSAPEPLLTVDELAVIIRRKPRWVAEQVRIRAFPATRIGRSVLFTVEQVEEIKAAGEQPVEIAPVPVHAGMTARSMARQRAS